MNKPVEWINKTEWRLLTELEICAMGVFHKSMGDAMKIEYTVLPGSQRGWKNGLQFYEELDRWSKDYENTNMVPHRNNYLTAVETRNLLLLTIPPFLHAAVRGVLAAGLDDLLREAIMFEAPSETACKFLDGFIALRRLLLRHLALPRPSFMRSQFENDELAPMAR